MSFPSKISFPPFEAGAVWLVGSGPGDPKLLTLFALFAIENCDVVVFDALVGAEVLALIPASVQKIKMGKRGGLSSPKQKEINAQLIELAQNNKRVLRLKGGDPFVFGRGAEEAIELMQEGVSVRIIPGISAGIAGTAYGGVPVSEGARNQVISFVSGHNPKGRVSDLNWQALSDSSPVIVFYMPMNHLEDIQSALLKAGRGQDEPVFFISKATTPDQVTLDSTLKNCLYDCEKNDIKAPALMVIGPTLDLRPLLKACFE